MGGRQGADEKCQAAAEAAALAGVFRAWLSTDVSSPETDFAMSAIPYVRLDDVVVAADWQDLIDGTLEAPIIVSELGGPPAAGTHGCMPSDALVAWTSTTEAGKALMTGVCENWSGTSGAATVGHVGPVNFTWSAYCSTACTGQAALFCFEQ